MKRKVASGLGGEASVLAEVRYVPVRILLVADRELAKRRWLRRTLCNSFCPQRPSAMALGVVSAPLWLVKAEPRGGLCSNSPWIGPLS